MTLRFVAHDDVVFRRAPLVTVLCQVQFEPVLSLLSDVGIAGFQDRLRDDYPFLRPEIGTQVAIEQSPRPRMGVRTSPPIWRMQDESETWHWRVSVAVNFLAIETPRYTEFGEFIRRLTDILDVLDRTIHPGDATRIGLRKINVLRHPEVHESSDWTRFLRREFVSLVGSELPGTVTQSLADVRISDPPNELMIRHGIVPGAVLSQAMAGVLAPPNGQEDPMDWSREVAPSEDGPVPYLLDLDYRTPVPYPLSQPDAIAELLQDFSNGITSFFHWATNDDYRRWLEPVPRAEVTERERS